MTPCIFESLLFICLLRKFVQLSIVSFVNCLLCQYSARHISSKKNRWVSGSKTPLKTIMTTIILFIGVFFPQYHPSISPHSMRNHIVVVAEKGKQYPKRYKLFDKYSSNSIHCWDSVLFNDKSRVYLSFLTPSVD